MVYTPRLQFGTSLIEMMITVTLSIAALACLLKAYDDSKASFRMQDSLSRLQENARYAIGLISRDVRMAGYRSCMRDGKHARLLSILSTPTAFNYDIATPIQGNEGNPDGSWNPKLDPSIRSAIKGTDVLVVRGITEGEAYLREDTDSHASEFRVITTPDTATFSPGDIAMISDCQGGVVFQVGRYSSRAGLLSLIPTGGNLAPGNKSTNIGRYFRQGSVIHRLATTSFYIRNGNNGPSLWRKQGASAAQELVEGVQSLQLLFGEDTNDDGMPDLYVNASSVSQFKNVVSVRIGFLFRSTEATTKFSDSRTYALLDHEAGPFNDRRIYRDISTTIALRNKVH